ncbi:MAG: cytochrome c biogenesis CcdA family protein [Actinomycetota bacterium]
MNLLLGGGALAAFFAGAVALFSPCCIVFLLPAYLASAVQGRRWALFPLTLAFAAGLALVILPLTLGFALIASFVTRFHTPLYLAGGSLMLGLAFLAFTGKTWNMPTSWRAPALEQTNASGVFALGVFSGIASSCCAPVLAGIVTLSALSGSALGSVILGSAYVFGMVVPLFVIALAWDRVHLGDRRILVGHDVTIGNGPRAMHTSTTNIVVAAVFGVMGLLVIGLGLSGNPMWAPGAQAMFGRWLTDAAGGVLSFLRPVPEPVLGIGLLLLAAAIGWLGIRGSRRADLTPEGGSDDFEDEDACHAHAAGTRS